MTFKYHSTIIDTLPEGKSIHLQTVAYLYLQ